MKFRQAVLVDRETQTDSATKSVDLDLQGLISALKFRVLCVNGATSNKDNFIEDIVTKIEVVDGSEVLVSLNGHQLSAIQHYSAGIAPVLFPSAHASGNQRSEYTLTFGRHLWDTKWALDPAKFVNPQVKVTFNKAAIRAASATGFASGDNIALSIVAFVMEDAPAPAGFLMKKEIEAYTTLSSGDHRTELPRDYPYRMIMLRSYEEEVDIDEAITTLKLTCDTDRYVIFNRRVADLDAEALSQFGLTTLKHDPFVSHQESVRIHHNKEPIVAPYIFAHEADDIVGVEYAWSNQTKFNMYSDAGVADTTDRKITCLITGHALNATLPIPMGIMDDDTTWFEPSAYGKIELVQTNGNAGGTAQIVVEQARRY